MKDWQKKQREFEQVKARAKALKLRLSCTICGANPKTLLNCPCGTTQCASGAERVGAPELGGGALARDATRQVLLDGLSTHRLARPRPPQSL